MATRVVKPRAPDPYLYPEPDPECLRILQELYSRYSGYQISACIRVIRAEIDAKKAQNS